MFIDSVKLTLVAGDGGAGAVSFRREKFVPLGGPDGGDGGKGGDVVVICDNNAHTLANFKGMKKLAAQNGEKGAKKNCRGKSGKDLQIRVPQGTQVINADTGEVMADLVCVNERKVLLRGGKGGLGNVHFKSASNQRPDYAQPGLKGEAAAVRLELKLIADVGLVGFPNVGKSTLISVLSNAKPEIADYEFTTLTPKLGLVEFGDDDSFVIADIPGIIEGASGGKGLGLAFLKHIERTKFLLFVLDFTRNLSLKEQFLALQKELGEFSPSLAKRAFGIALSKCDSVKFGDDFKQNFTRQSEDLRGFLKENQNPQKFILELSSLENLGLNELKFTLNKEILELKSENLGENLGEIHGEIQGEIQANFSQNSAKIYGEKQIQGENLSENLGEFKHENFSEIHSKNSDEFEHEIQRENSQIYMQNDNLQSKNKHEIQPNLSKIQASQSPENTAFEKSDTSQKA